MAVASMFNCLNHPMRGSRWLLNDANVTEQLKGSLEVRQAGEVDSWSCDLFQRQKVRRLDDPIYNRVLNCLIGKVLLRGFGE